MKIALFGITGETGKRVAKYALTHDVEVTALCRDASHCDRASSRVKIIEGPLEEYHSVKTALQGCDAAVITIGPRSPYLDIFCAEATKNIVDAMKEVGVKRLICVTGAMVGDYKSNRTLSFNMMKNIVVKSQRGTMEDRDKQEEIVKNSGLSWLIVKPPRLSDAEHNGTYKVGETVKVGMLSSIGRDDLAHYIIDEVTKDHDENKIEFMKY